MYFVLVDIKLYKFIYNIVGFFLMFFVLDDVKLSKTINKSKDFYYCLIFYFILSYLTLNQSLRRLKL